MSDALPSSPSVSTTTPTTAMSDAHVSHAHAKSHTRTFISASLSLSLNSHVCVCVCVRDIDDPMSTGVDAHLSKLETQLEERAEHFSIVVNTKLQPFPDVSSSCDPINHSRVCVCVCM